MVGYNSTKTDRPSLPFLVGPHAALCKPDQDLAQLPLSLYQAAPPRLSRRPDELSPTPLLYLLPVHMSLLSLCDRFGPRKCPSRIFVDFTQIIRLAKIAIDVNALVY
jgi:hypothetical protein